MIRPATPPPGSDVLLHCTAERTLVRSIDPESGRLEVRKLLLRGSLTDAERECELGQQVRDLDVVQYVAAELDAVTNRPCVRMAYHAGCDLDLLVAQEGAAAPARACALLAPVAVTIAAMHARGLCHGDIKPANLLATHGTPVSGESACADTPKHTTLLLDFEHAAATGSVAATGTGGYAAPEAQSGSVLQPSFDIYGLGATLYFLLTGRPPLGTNPMLVLERIAVPDEMRVLLQACLAQQPTQRPDADTVVEALRELGTRLTTGAHVAANHALASCDLAALKRIVDQPSRSTQVQQQARRLLQRGLQLEALLRRRLGAQPADMQPSELASHVRDLTRLLRRYPQLSAAAQARWRAKNVAGELLAEQLPTISELLREEAFDQATQRLLDLDAMVTTVLDTPGPLRIPGEGDARMPTPLQRQPRGSLQQETRRLLLARNEHQELLTELDAAEEALELDTAEAVIDRMAQRHGGASVAVAKHRDRLHRLGFYLERIGRARPNLQRLQELAPNEDLTPLLQRVDECSKAAASAPASDDSSGGTMGLRQLQIALNNLIDEFPPLQGRLRPGLSCLERVLGGVTDEAWQLLQDASDKLAAEPVPVRPLQMLVSRLDTFRTLEAVIDRPDRPRSSLLDRIESLRLRLEQAQATRDRLARGAEQALAKGHWTTGLFDMERAVTRLEDGTADDEETERLRTRLAEARRRKEEIERSQHRNTELLRRHAELVDDIHSTFAERLHVLEQRRDCLQFLAVHAQQERSSLYARDLQDVEIGIAQVHAEQAATELDATEDLRMRLRIAQRTLDKLESRALEDGRKELPGRLQRLLDSWRRRVDKERRDADRLARDTARARSKRRRTALASGATALVLLVLGTLWFQEPASAGADLPALVRTLPTDQRNLADQLAHTAGAAKTRGSATPDSWLAELEERAKRLLAIDSKASDATPQAARFVATAWRQALAAAWENESWQRDRSALQSRVDAATAALRTAGLPE